MRYRKGSKEQEVSDRYLVTFPFLVSFLIFPVC